jgi:hypothetical protein
VHWVIGTPYPNLPARRGQGSGNRATETGWRRRSDARDSRFPTQRDRVFVPLQRTTDLPSSADRYAAQTTSIVRRLSEARVSCSWPVSKPWMKCRWVAA